MINWAENRNLFSGLAVGLLMAGLVSDTARQIAVATALALSVACGVMSQRQKNAKVTT